MRRKFSSKQIYLKEVKKVLSNLIGENAHVSSSTVGGFETLSQRFVHLSYYMKYVKCSKDQLVEINLKRQKE